MKKVFTPLTQPNRGIFDMDYSRSNSAELRRIAQAEGKHLYFTGKPCKNGHDAGRYTASGHCSICASEKASRSHKKARHGEKGDEVRAKANAYRAEWRKRPEVQEMLSRKGKKRNGLSLIESDGRSSRALTPRITRQFVLASRAG